MYLVANNSHMLEAFDDESGECLGALCEEVYVKEEHIDLLTGNRKIILSLWVDGEELELEAIGRDALNRNVCRLLSIKGFTMLETAENIEVLLGHLLDSCKAAPKLYVHDQLGICNVDDETVFLANEVIGISETDKKAKSKYIGKEKVAPCGTLESWKTIIESEVLGHTNAELALAIGALAPVAYILQEAKLFTEVPILGIIGQSSTGKTTALRLMASIYGSPEEGSGLIKDFNATDNAISASLQDSGMIHILDESTICGQRDFSNIFYCWSKGVDKLRCDSSGNIKERREFSGSIIYSGENSPLNMSCFDLGLYARVVEFNLHWTDDDAHARRLVSGVRQNYGCAIIPYAKHLLKLRRHPDIVQRIFTEELKKFKTSIKNVSPIQERILNIFASLILSAKLFEKAIGLKLNIKAIRDLLTSIYDSSPSREDLAMELYHAVMDEIALHNQHFPSKDGKNRDYPLLSEMWGECVTNNSSKNIWIAGVKFKEFAVKSGFENYGQYLEVLRNQGLLKKYSDGYTTKHRLGPHSPRCYCLYEERSK